MKRRLFLREYWRPAAAGSAALAAAMLATRLAEAFVAASSVQDFRDAVDYLVVFLLPVCGFIAGERTFSSDLKERRILLLQLLPVSRSALWAVLVGARLLAGFSAIAVALACRPTVLKWMASQPVTAVALLPIFLVFFALGVTVSLLWRSVLAVYLTGGAIAAAVAPPLLLAATFLATLRTFHYRFLFGEIGIVVVLGALASLVVLVGTLLSASWRIFRSGELLFPRRRLVRTGALAAVLVTATLLLRWLLVWPAPAWAYDRRWSLEEIEPAPDGAHVVVVERSAVHPRLTRVTLLTAATGRVEWTHQMAGVIDVGWCPGARTIGVVQRRGHRPRFVTVGGGSTHVLRIGLDGETLGEETFEGVQDAWWGERRTLLITRSGELSELRQVGRPAPLAQAPADDRLSFTAGGDRVAAVVVHPSVPVSGWLIGADEVHSATGPRPDVMRQSIALLVGDMALDGHSAAGELAKRLGLPVAGAPTVFLLGEDTQEGPGDRYPDTPNVIDVETSPAIYAATIDCRSGLGDLYVRLRDAPRWSLVGTGLPAVAYCQTYANERLAEAAAVPASGLQGGGGRVMDLTSGVFAYAAREPGRLTVYLFDPTLGRSVVLASEGKPAGQTAADSASPMNVDLRAELPPAALRGVLTLARGAGRRVATRWRYVPGSGHVEVLATTVGVKGVRTFGWPLAAAGELDWGWSAEQDERYLVYFAADRRERWRFPANNSR